MKWNHTILDEVKVKILNMLHNLENENMITTLQWHLITFTTTIFNHSFSHFSQHPTSWNTINVLWWQTPFTVLNRNLYLPFAVKVLFLHLYWHIFREHPNNIQFVSENRLRRVRSWVQLLTELACFVSTKQWKMDSVCDVL